MKIHKNAKLTPKSREEMVKRMQTHPVSVVASGFGVSTRTAYKWKKRYSQGGILALYDVSSRPKRCRSRLCQKNIEHILTLRKKRLIEDTISEQLGLSRNSVFRAFKRCSLSLLSSLDIKEPIIRYQWERPGQMLHIDVKKLGRIDGVASLAGQTESKAAAYWLGVSACLRR